MSEPLHVLHVTETFSAGTGTAVVGFARALRSAGIESSLLAQDRGSGLLDSLPDEPFAAAEIVPPGLGRLWSALGPTVARLRPDVVHVHSSLAGAVARARLRLLPHRPAVVYSPHCFAFERQDLAPASRRAMWLAEWVLARTTDAYVCVSPHEAELATVLRRRTPTYALVNRFEPDVAVDRSTSAAPAHGVRLVTIGRVAPQKDPALFAAVVAALRETTEEVSAVWIGAGDDARSLATLASGAITVTGWLPAHDVPQALAAGTYVHTAAWEAAVPLAVLDAMAAGLPVVVRRHPAYRDMIPDAWQFDTPAQAVAMITELDEPAARARRCADQRSCLTTLYQRGPAVVLPEAYHDVVRRARS